MNRSLPVITDADHVKPDLCGPCGGKCCQHYPGLAAPSDFGNDKFTIESNILAALETGRWTMEKVGKYVNNHYLTTLVVRPAMKGSEGRAYDNGFYGACTFHTANGCGVFENRPFQCRSLEPKSDMGCTQHAKQQDVGDLWEPYQSTLETLMNLLD